MAYYAWQSAHRVSHMLLFLVLLSFSLQVAVAGRQVPGAGAASADKNKKQKECLDQEGTVVIPGVGRYMIGSHDIPGIIGLDNSGPAAANAQYRPGNDDTFVPNPGFEVPNPERSVP